MKPNGTDPPALGRDLEEAIAARDLPCRRLDGPAEPTSRERPFTLPLAIAGEAARELRELLRALGFRRVIPARGADPQGGEDWLGCDSESGRFVLARLLHESPGAGVSLPEPALAAGDRWQLPEGGRTVAILGSDGSGKSTAIDHLEAWLSPVLEVDRVHLGKPPWSRTTRAVRAATKLGRMLTRRRFLSTAKALHGEGTATPGLDVLLRELCTGRDRRLHHARARRLVRRGMLVLCDRHPLPEIRLMDGPVIGLLRPEGRRGPLVRLLMALEERPYRRIGAPDLAIVLRVDPEEAVRRKPEDDADYVRARATEIWTAKWSRPGVHVLDAGRPKDEVLAELRRVVWAELESGSSLLTAGPAGGGS